MSTQTVTIRIVGISPLIHHNGQLADPLCPATKALGRISSKRKKTDADHEEMARLEFGGSLYMDSKGPIIPAENIEAALIDGAKKLRKGTEAKSGLYVLKNAPLLYEGPRDAKGLWEDESFRLRNAMRIKQSRIMRTRPIFREWQADITLEFEDEILNHSDVMDFLRKAGEVVGIGDSRPRFGRFKIA